MILIVVDFQRGLDDPQYGPRSNPLCEQNLKTLLEAWRSAGLKLMFTRHFSSRKNSPLAPNGWGSEIKEEVGPGIEEKVYIKSTNSAFKNPEFAAAVGRRSEPLFFSGIATDACVTATAREAKDLGYEVAVVADACATFDRRDLNGETVPADLVDRVALAALQGSDIRLLRTADLVSLVERLPIG